MYLKAMLSQQNKIDVRENIIIFVMHWCQIGIGIEREEMVSKHHSHRENKPQ